MEPEQLTDTTIIDLHRLQEPVTVASVEGSAWTVDGESNRVKARLAPGDRLEIGDTIALEAEARVVISSLVLTGGRRGRAHSFVAEDAFKSSPSREDVPRLLGELQRLERQLSDERGEDPLSLQEPPSTPFDRSMSSEFALLNLTAEGSTALPAELSQREGAVVLFISGDGAHVAVNQLSLRKLRILMTALGRPVTPHLVDQETLRRLVERVPRAHSIRP